MTKFEHWCYDSTFRLRYPLPEIRPFPAWAKNRPGWHYCGWDSKTTFLGSTFEERRKQTRDHGERRKTDVYPEGAVFWCQEPSPLFRLWQRIVCCFVGHNFDPGRYGPEPWNVCRHCGTKRCN